MFLLTCFAHLLQNCNPGQKSLGQYCNINIRIFLSFLGSLLKRCIFFENFLQFSLPPPYKKLKLKKKFWIKASNIVCGVRGGVGPVWIGKRPRNESGSLDSCPWLCLHQKLQSVTLLNWTCIATFLVHNVKLWSNIIFERIIRVWLQLNKVLSREAQPRGPTPYPYFLLYIPFFTQKVTLQCIFCWQMVFPPYPMIYLKPTLKNVSLKFFRNGKTDCETTIKLEEKLPRITSFGLFYFASSSLCTKR